MGHPMDAAAPGFAWCTTFVAVNGLATAAPVSTSCIDFSKIESENDVFAGESNALRAKQEEYNNEKKIIEIRI